MPEPTTSGTDARAAGTRTARAPNGRAGPSDVRASDPRPSDARPGADPRPTWRARLGLARIADAPVSPTRAAAVGVGAIVTVLVIAAVVLLTALPSSSAFDARIARIFAENDDLTSQAEIKLLEILAQSNTIFDEALSGYRLSIVVLLIFASALMVAALSFLLIILSLQRRMGEIERAGIRVSSLLISRETRTVWLNDLEFQLTEAAIETLSVLAEARMDDEILSGAEIEAVVSGRDASECDEASGATRIKRLRDAMGNQIVTALLIRTIARRGYTLSIEPGVIRMV